jgi:hypothetical protein
MKIYKRREVIKVKKRLLLSLLLAVVMVMAFAVPIMAADYDEVVVTATPAFLAISNAPGTWAPNDIVGDGVTPKGTIAPDTYYYSNPLGDELEPSDPVVDGECRFTVTNTSSVPIDLTVNFPDFTGGDASTNSEDGSNGASTFGAYSYCTGMTYSTGKVVAKTTGSDPMKENLAATTDIKWGLAYETQTDAWTSGTAMESTVVITATVYMA